MTVYSTPERVNHELTAGAPLAAANQLHEAFSARVIRVKDAWREVVSFD
jgi:hypothetical protein